MLFLAELCRHFNTANVLAAAIEMCKTLPLGPKAFMKHACAQRARPGGCS